MKNIKIEQQPRALDLVHYGHAHCSLGSEPKVLGLGRNFLCARTHPQACLRARPIVHLDWTVTDA
jgi:hypothetical protein